MRNRIYILNPQYHLRNDGRRILLFSRSYTDSRSADNWYAFIHPLQAVLLSFFTYRRTLSENLFLLSGYLHRDVADAERFVTPFLENEQPFHTVWKETKIRFPRNVLVPYTGSEAFRQLSPDSFVCFRLDLTTRRLYRAPLSVTLMLTNRCATHCCYCYADTSTPVTRPLPTRRILRLIDEAGRLPLKHVNLMGGEIFLHPDWETILRKTVGCGVAPEYLSTKLPFTPQRIEALQTIGYKGLVQVSLDAADTEILQATLHVSADYWPAMQEGLKLLDASGLTYQVATVLTTHNCDSDTLYRLFRFLSTLRHLSCWNLVPVNNSIRMDAARMASLKPTREQLRQAFELVNRVIIPNTSCKIRFVKELLERKFHTADGGSRNFEGTKCSALNTHFFILPDGKVTICEQLYWHPRFLIGDVSRQSLTQVWQSIRSTSLYASAWKEVRTESACHDCPLLAACFSSNNRCWADIIKAYGSENWDYPDPRCKYALPMKNNIGY